jgi:hypothetical protein
MADEPTLTVGTLSSRLGSRAFVVDEPAGKSF